jgi:hypothetical protein
MDHDYLRVIVKEKKAELPSNYGTRWRRYEAFHASEIDALGFVCSNWLVPKLKLYRLQKPQMAKAATGATGEEKKRQPVM